MLAKQREAIKALGGNLREAETRLAAFQAKAKDSGGASGALALKLARAEEEVGQLSAKLMQSGRGLPRNRGSGNERGQQDR